MLASSRAGEPQSCARWPQEFVPALCVRPLRPSHAAASPAARLCLNPSSIPCLVPAACSPAGPPPGGTHVPSSQQTPHPQGGAQHNGGWLGGRGWQGGWERGWLALPCPASRRRQNLRALCLHIVQPCGTQVKVCCCAPCGGWTGGRFTLPGRRLLSADPELPACTADSCLPCLPSPLQDVPLLGQLLLAGGQQHVEERRWMMQVGSCGGGGSMGGQAGSSSEATPPSLCTHC